MNLLYFLFCLVTAMIANHIYDDLFWAIISFLFAPFAWIKWLVCKEVNWTVIKETFSFFKE